MLNVFLLYHKNPTPTLRNQLVTMNLGLARTVAHAIAKVTKDSYEDLQQVAFLGLITAVERFDPTIGLKFSTYAVPTIYGKVLQYIRDKSGTIRIPQNLQSLYTKKLKAELLLQQELGRLPTSHEVCDRLGIETDVLSSLALVKQNKTPVSLSTPISTDSTNESITLEDSLVAGDYQTLPSLPTVPAQPLASVSEDNAGVLELVFQNNSNCKSAASTLGVSATAVKQKLRDAVREYAGVNG